MTPISSATRTPPSGELTAHRWLDTAELPEDAYSLFHARAVSLGWARSSAGEAGCEHWGMNDAGQDWAADGSSPLAWFQVCLPDRSALPDEAVPIQALLACAGETIGRVGSLRLDAVQVLTQPRRHRGDRSRLSAGLNWFELADPAGRVPVRVILDSGTDTAAVRRAQRVLDTARSRRDPMFWLTDFTVGDSGTHRRAIVDDLWLGAGRHPVTYTGSVPEWSIAAVGWMVELVLELGRSAGIDSPLLVTVEHAT